MVNELLIVNLLMSKYTLDEVHKLKLLIYALILSLSKSEQKKDAPNTEVNSSEKSSIDDSACKNSAYKQSTSNDTDTANSYNSNASISNTDTNTYTNTSPNTDTNTYTNTSPNTNTNNNSYTNTNANTNTYNANINNNSNINLRTNINTNTTINSSDENIFNLLKNGFQGTNTTLLLTSGETVTGQVLGSYYGNVIMIKVGAIIKFIDGNSIIGFY
ncbi:hypothetical protein [Desnuesiella massiliensis]|uniref:hypothetical protein n=1 Tax=Desnuesiella massiliensis TaxID=1650662 RepID=UPI0006E285CC|nr:hypothetical protein [Desnuesiella massiliensis]